MAISINSPGSFPIMDSTRAEFLTADNKAISKSQNEARISTSFNFS